MDARLLPMRPTDARVDVASVEWLFSPDWPGERLIARLRADGVHLTDAAGEPVDDRPDLAVSLGRAISAEHATVDGVWTEHPLLADAEPGSAFVAIDLLELDGEPLLDVPYLERHRLLEAVIDASVEVRVSLVVKHPISGWLGGWREQGFGHYFARHQNSRYRPGDQTDDWYRIPIVGNASPGIVQRAIGRGRQRGPGRIRD